MKPSSQLRGLYNRIYRNREALTFQTLPGDGSDRSCIFCDEINQEPQLQSVYYPPLKVAEKLLSADNKGVTAYACVNHYYRYNRITNAGHLFPTFEDFYISVGPVLKRRQRSTGDGQLKYFAVTSDVGTSGFVESTVWYSGFGFSDQVRIRHPLYMAFCKFVHETAILGLLVEGRRSWYQKFCAENEVNEKESQAFEHFLKL